jgi:cholesterol transport system auxiliary component
MTPMRRPRLATAPTIVLTLLLGGCVTLFPKTVPAQLYRFEATPAAASAPASPAPPVVVQAGVMGFDPAAAGDRLLTTRGDEVAYVADARWETAANTLFEQALDAGFAASGRIRLVDVAAPKATYRLRLTVSRFETAYPPGKGATPSVVIQVHAALDREQDLSVVAEKDFEASAPAGEDRVGAIVDAYNVAVTKVVGDLVSWTEETAPPPT